MFCLLTFEVILVVFNKTQCFVCLGILKKIVEYYPLTHAPLTSQIEISQERAHLLLKQRSIVEATITRIKRFLESVGIYST